MYARRNIRRFYTLVIKLFIDAIMLVEWKYAYCETFFHDDDKVNQIFDRFSEPTFLWLVKNNDSIA